MLIVADSDVLIDFLAGKKPGADRVAAEREVGRLVTTSVARSELLSGGRTLRSRKAIVTLLESVPALPLESAAADRAAEVRQELERAGEPIGMGDCLIGWIVLANEAELLTRNTRHFGRVKSLRLASPER